MPRLMISALFISLLLFATPSFGGAGRDVLFTNSDLAADSPGYCARQEVIVRLAEANPNNAVRQHDLFVSYINAGNVLAARGDLEEALKSFRDGLGMIEELTQADPNDAGWQRDLLVSCTKIGEVLEVQGKLDEALKSLRYGLITIKPLAIVNPFDRAPQRDLASFACGA
jgi:tetratricopeptide (TPR) repeat protein